MKQTQTYFIYKYKDKIIYRKLFCPGKDIVVDIHDCLDAWEKYFQAKRRAQAFKFNSDVSKVKVHMKKLSFKKRLRTVWQLLFDDKIPDFGY